MSTTCILLRISHTEGKVQIGYNQSRSPPPPPPRKYCPFLLLNVSLLIRDRNVSLVEVYWRYTEFQFVFPNKSRWNYIFQATNCRRIIMIFSLLEERQ